MELNQYELKPKDQDWFDKELLALKGGVSEIIGKDFTLLKNKDDGNWSAKDIKDDEKTNKSKADELVTHLRGLRIESLADEETRERLMEGKPDSSLIVKTGNQSIMYDGYKLDDKYYVKGSLEDHYFSVLKYHYDRLFEIKRKEFIEDKRDNAS